MRLEGKHIDGVGEESSFICVGDVGLDVQIGGLAGRSDYPLLARAIHSS